MSSEWGALGIRRAGSMVNFFSGSLVEFIFVTINRFFFGSLVTRIVSAAFQPKSFRIFFGSTSAKLYPENLIKLRFTDRISIY